MMMNIEKIKGIIPPVITPITENENVDEKGFRALLRHCVDNGLHGIFVAGSNGETMSLTQEQRNKAIKIALDEVGDEVPVLCGVMDTSTRRVIENIKALEQMGGAIAVVTPAFYIRNSCQQEVISHFEEIARNTDISIMIYNIPQFTQVNIKPETVFELSKIDNIIGLKESGGSLLQIQKCLNYFKGTDFKIYQGTTDMGGISILMGADGMIPVLAPLFPEIFIKLYEAASSKRLEETLYMQEIVCKTSKILSMAANATSAAKYAISLLGLTGKQVTKPCEPITDAEEEKIKEFVKYILEKYESQKVFS